MLLFGEAFAQAIDMHIERALVALEIVAPDVLDQLLARERLAGIAGELEQQLEFFQRQGEAFAV